MNQRQLLTFLWRELFIKLSDQSSNLSARWSLTFWESYEQEGIHSWDCRNWSTVSAIKHWAVARLKINNENNKKLSFNFYFQNDKKTYQKQILCNKTLPVRHHHQTIPSPQQHCCKAANKTIPWPKQGFCNPSSKQ